LIHPYAARVRVVKQRLAERGKDAPNGSENLSLFTFLKNSLSQAAEKDSEARRAKDRRAKAYSLLYVGARRLSATKPMRLF